MGMGLNQHKLKATGLFLFICASVLSIPTYAQQEAGIELNLTINGESIKAGQSYYITSIKDSVQLEAVKFYISDVEVFRNKKKVGESKKKHQLIDIEQPESLQLALQTDAKFNTIKFNIGIDSLTSVSGAFGGDLDPTNGMYWTWQSGYINVKIEGTASSCLARNNFFQFHLGGYQEPFYMLQKVELRSRCTNKTVIEIPIDELLTASDLTKDYEIMSSSQKAVDMAKLFASIFSISK